MTAKEVLLLRHGQTEWNLVRRWQGQMDVTLSDVGRGQAKRAAAGLAARYGHVVGRVAASDLRRAAATADAVAAEVSSVAGVTLDVHTDPRFREYSSGHFEGLHIEEVMSQHHENFDAFCRGEDVRVGLTGERPSEVASRMAQGLRDHVAATPDGTTLLIASHGGALRLLTYTLMGPAQPSRGLGVLDNCHWAILRPQPDDGSWALHAWNVGVAPQQ